ncbi:MAG: PLP-dependent aminotransferase family protein [Actinomycetota bacterium]|nr:PLP-dependent aminotransferase family protein [Actinomycetota bacterium]
MSIIARLVSDSPVPLYRQLREALEESITAGHFPDGRLPSSRALAAELGISRNTVNLAYQELVVDGYVTAHPRSGLVVNEEIQRRPVGQPSEEEDLEQAPDWSEFLGPSPPDPFGALGIPSDWSDYRYPFLSNQVDSQALPYRALARSFREAVQPQHVSASLQDSRGQDDELLVEQLITQILPARGIQATPDQILITLGTQQAFYLIGKTLVAPGTRIAIEDPGWADARVILTAAGGEIVPVEVDEGGIELSTSLNHVRLICTTPSHQFPTGVTLGVARRRALLDIAAASDSLIIEDDYDSELRYRGRPTPALKGLDELGRVVYLGSLSKLVAPGLRLGFIVANPELIESMRRWRRVMVRHPPGLVQRAMALFIQSGEYHRWLRQLRSSMKRKWQLIVPAVAEHIPWEIGEPTGGLGIWVVGPKGFDSRILVNEVREKGVLLEHGQPLFARVAPTHTFRLGYTAIREERIEAGVEIVGKAAKRIASLSPI